SRRQQRVSMHRRRRDRLTRVPTERVIDRCDEWRIPIEGRPNIIDFDPLEPISDRIMTTLLVGEPRDPGVEIRYGLVLEHRGDETLIADPAGAGLVTFRAAELRLAWREGARRGRKPWLGTISGRSARTGGPWDG